MREMPLLALILLGLAGPARTQEPPPQDAPELTFSGGIDLHFARRNGEIERTRLFLGSTVAPDRLDSDGFYSGRLFLRLDAKLDRDTRAVVELANRPYAAGENLPFGDEPAEVRFEQAYVEALQLPWPGVSIRFGVQDARLTLRPHAEPFFLDAGRAESFYSGLTAGAQPFVAMTTDRDLGQPVGLRLQVDPLDFVTVQAFSGITREGFSTSEDEILNYFYGNLWIPEQLSAFVLAALVTGPRAKADVWTAGLGFDAYASREVELFAEGYVQGGRLGGGVRKGGLGGQAGVRGWSGKAFVEASATHRSGDAHPGDGRDRSFQSYENVNQFMIVESAEFGLDLDTNIDSARLAIGLQGADLGGRFKDVTLRLDVGIFRLDQEIAGEDKVGTELDFTASWACSRHVTLDIKGALLSGSDVLEALAKGNGLGLSTESESSILGMTAGASVRF